MNSQTSITEGSPLKQDIKRREWENLVVDFEKHEMFGADGNSIRFTKREKKCLELLALSAGTLCTKRTLLDHIYHSVTQPDWKIVEVFISCIRKKLGHACLGKRYIETVWGMGYVMEKPLREYIETCESSILPEPVREPTNPAPQKKLYAKGLDGVRITLHDLPDPGRVRWVARRKAELACAIKGGLISLDDACTRYSLPKVEVLIWQETFAQFGVQGLRATRFQQYRV